MVVIDTPTRKLRFESLSVKCTYQMGSVGISWDQKGRHILTQKMEALKVNLS